MTSWSLSLLSGLASARGCTSSHKKRLQSETAERSINMSVNGAKGNSRKHVYGIVALHYEQHVHRTLFQPAFDLLSCVATTFARIAFKSQQASPATACRYWIQFYGVVEMSLCVRQRSSAADAVYPPSISCYLHHATLQIRARWRQACLRESCVMKWLRMGCLLDAAHTEDSVACCRTVQARDTAPGRVALHTQHRHDHAPP